MAPSRFSYMDRLDKPLEGLEVLRADLHMVSYLADAAQHVVECDDQAQSPPLPTLQKFIHCLVFKSKVPVPTLMSSLVYIRRLKSRLAHGSRGARSTGHRIFLACLILAAKYLHDSSPSNKLWAVWTNITTEEYQFGFNTHEVSTMERHLFISLQCNAHISAGDLEHERHLFLRFKACQERLEAAAALILLSKRPTTFAPTGNEPAHYTAKRKGKIGSSHCRSDVRWRSISYPNPHQSSDKNTQNKIAENLRSTGWVFQHLGETCQRQEGHGASMEANYSTHHLPPPPPEQTRVPTDDYVRMLKALEKANKELLWKFRASRGHEGV